MAQLTVQESDHLADILNEGISKSQTVELERFVSTKFVYTSQLLSALALVYGRDYGDSEGSALIEEFARKFAEHEARTV